MHYTYHNELYPGISTYKDRVIAYAMEHGYVHLGLGCRLYSKDIDKHNRTLFNATCQFWSILTLLTIHDLHVMLEEQGLDDKVKVIATIYDSIYIMVEKNVNTIQLVNNFVIEKLTKDFLEDQQVHNSAKGEIGYNWYDTVSLSNNASKTEILQALRRIDGY